MTLWKVVTYSGLTLDWFGDSRTEVRQEAEQLGHKVRRAEPRPKRQNMDGSFQPCGGGRRIIRKRPCSGNY